ncbi:MAG: histidinol dehydrogenase [Breznakibacter sp.]|nr:histidinol dehydrogenase [Breznakibacter sp.]
MNIYKYPSPSDYEQLAQRTEIDLSNLFDTVKDVLVQIKQEGDKAVYELGKKFDGADLKSLLVSEAEIEKACSEVSDDLKEAINQAKSNIDKFHASQRFIGQKIDTMPGVTCWQKSMPIEKVGLYIPGGTAPLFSTVLMLAVPANIAGCKEIVLCSPPNKEGKLHPAILYTASLCGIKKIFKIGGIQAIGAMAYGTESVPKVYKIFGPGNRYVTAAKQLVSLKDVAIDMPAGPSEVQVMADESANVAFIASDLLSQAEHGADSQVIFTTTYEPIIEAVKAELDKQLNQLPRKEVAEKALQNSRVILFKSMDEMVAYTNVYAPEHLILSVNNCDAIADQITNAGSIFLGNYTPESAGDYASGTNHTLPTHGYARAYSGVNLDSFMKRITLQKITKEGLNALGPFIEKMAEEEQLEAHKNAVTLRLKSN